MQSLLYHTFKLQNNIREGYRIAPRLPPSAMTIWPVMDGTEDDNETNNQPSTQTTSRRQAASNTLDGQQETNDYGLNLFL
jgi:hypothetical protein